MKQKNNYYIGFDIGTDSVGYAVTDIDYNLLKFKNEKMWGSHIFDKANLCNDRRKKRTERRRIDRRQQRVKFIQEIFASEIDKVDPDFYNRIRESRLYKEDSHYDKGLFIDKNYNDSHYYQEYPTIHHLIKALMEGKEKQDVRKLYIACAWLVAHRGHFLNEISKDNIDQITDINDLYKNFVSFFEIDNIWCNIDVEKFASILSQDLCTNKKIALITEKIFNGKKLSNKSSEEFPYRNDLILKLFCGGKCDISNLINKEEYKENKTSISLNMKDDDYDKIIPILEYDGELIIRMKMIYDCIILKKILKNSKYISYSKIDIYNQHKNDLKNLKYLIKKYCPEKYDEVFRMSNSTPFNYVKYSRNYTDIKLINSSDKSKKSEESKKSNKEKFYKYIKDILEAITPNKSDKKIYDDMLLRLQSDISTFMPKQVESDNRIIPYQLYYIELVKILDEASKYFSFLNEKDKDGYVVKDKIISVFEFRIPYYVGPLNKSSQFAWIEKKAEGKIYPWNFDKKVDLEASEEAFIKKLTNTCTYLPDQYVLPMMSLSYQKFNVLNEINNIKINGEKIPVEIKQSLYNNLFMIEKKVTVKQIKDFITTNYGNLYTKDDISMLSGLDIDVKSSLSSHIIFKPYLSNGKLSESDVEKIIYRGTCINDKYRFTEWLKNNFEQLKNDENALKDISSLKFKDFGRLSKEFLCEFIGADKQTGEVHTILEWMWQTNNNLMELLSDKYDFVSKIEERKSEYYKLNSSSLDKQLDDMYIPNNVKRPIIRTFDILNDIVKVNGNAPDKIFIEMARGSKENEKNKRSISRKDNILELYKAINKKDKFYDIKYINSLIQEIENMGEFANNKLQSDSLYLYFLQLGKCLYSGTKIELNQIADGTYNIDHILPQAKIKDDSFSNKALVDSKLNAIKGDKIPVRNVLEISSQICDWWKFLHKNKLMSDEKYNRLIRKSNYTTDEEWGFINRQLVETRQSTKAIATLLKKKYPETKIVYVKAGLISEFRQEFDLAKCRSVNDLHHAKDAYLSIVIGDIYNKKITKDWYLNNKNSYSIKINTIFGNDVVNNKEKIGDCINIKDKVVNCLKGNDIHYTSYAYTRKGVYFKVTPLGKSDKLYPLKKGMSPEKYGGYDSTSSAAFILARYKCKNKYELMIVTIEILYIEKFKNDAKFAAQYIKDTIENIINKKIDEVTFPLGNRILKINTVFEIDGFRIILSGKSSKGKQIIVAPFMPLILSQTEEFNIKKIDKYLEKIKENKKYIFNEKYDNIYKNNNLELFKKLQDKTRNSCYKNRPTMPSELVNLTDDEFNSKTINEQCKILQCFISIFSRKAISYSPYIKTASCLLNSNIANWESKEIYIIDTSASGLYEKKSENLKSLLKSNEIK